MENKNYGALVFTHSALVITFIGITLFSPAKIFAQVLPTNNPPNTPVITEPGSEGQVVHPADVHMETSPYSDLDTGDTHTCTDWEILEATSSALAWTAPCSPQLVHIHFGDGSFVGSYSGRTELNNDSNYILKARHKDNSGNATTEWSGWVQRGFTTSPPSTPGTTVAWSVRQPGYQVEVFAGGFQLPVNIAFLPNPGTLPSSPYFYVTELYGTIKVVTRDGTVTDYVRGVLNYRPSGVFPGSGEQGLAGIVVDPVSGDVFASMLYLAADGKTYPKVVRFKSNHGGSVSGSNTTILDMAGESQGQSHQISNLSIGPDGKLYVHMGDGFDTATAQNLNSFRGKILRMNLDGSPAIDNPFYNSLDGINSKDYVFAYGFRNPFGGAWRAADGFHYEVENGPSVDRFAKVIAGRNYLWNGSDTSMRNFALYNWSPAVAPVNLEFIEALKFNASGFPPEKIGNAFISESGPTYATGPQNNGKRISEFVLDGSGNLVSGPTPLIEYTGTGKATVSGLAAGLEGLYFIDLYKDNGTTATEIGARVLRVKYIGGQISDFSLSATPSIRRIKRGTPTTYTVVIAPNSGSAGNVNFSVSGLPSGVSASFNPNPGTTSTTMTLETSNTSPNGTYNIEITGNNGVYQHNTNTTLVLRR